jgi:flagellar basal body-associated protein FliL
VLKKRLLIFFMVVLVVGGANGCKWLHAKNAKEEKPVLEIVHLETFVVNLADDGQRTFLRVGVDLGVVAEKKKGKEGEARPVAPIRDAILEVLMAMKSDDVATTEGKEKLKQRVLKTLNEKLPELQAREVYFTEFLVQQ